MDMTQRGSLVVVVQGERVSPERRKDRRHTHTHTLHEKLRTNDGEVSVASTSHLSEPLWRWLGRSPASVSIARARCR